MVSSQQWGHNALPWLPLEVSLSRDSAGRVRLQLLRLRRQGWRSRSEGSPAARPPTPSHLAVSHFVFDSWVHEYDLMLPRGERPFVDPLEAEVTVRYLIGLAEVATGARTPLELRLTEPRYGSDLLSVPESSK